MVFFSSFFFFFFLSQTSQCICHRTSRDILGHLTATLDNPRKQELWTLNIASIYKVVHEWSHTQHSSVVHSLLHVCFRGTKCTSEHRTFNSSPISLHTALLYTLCYPYNTPEHRTNAWLIFGTSISDQHAKYSKALSIASELGDTCSCSLHNNLCNTSTIIAYV